MPIKTKNDNKPTSNSMSMCTCDYYFKATQPNPTSLISQDNTKLIPLISKQHSTEQGFQDMMSIVIIHQRCCLP